MAAEPKEGFNGFLLILNFQGFSKFFHLHCIKISLKHQKHDRRTTPHKELYQMEI